MPHISNIKLNEEVFEEIFKELVGSLDKANKKGNLYSLVEELFTSTEKIMLAKRLSIVLMLDRGVPQHKIVDILKVSPATVAKSSLKIDIHAYDTVLTLYKKQKLDVEKIAWTFFTAGGLMPPKAGRKYWVKYRNGHK